MHGGPARRSPAALGPAPLLERLTAAPAPHASALCGTREAAEQQLWMLVGRAVACEVMGW
jgi:hypothetical protein